MEGEAGCQCPPDYLRTIPGILKIVEMVLTILTFALSFGAWWDGSGGGWVEFVGISCFITVTIWLILHLINVIPGFVGRFLIEFISYCVMTILLLISGIVAAAMASRYRYYTIPSGSTIGACCFFAFASMVVCGVDAALQFLEYRHGGTAGTTTTTTATTTTTTSSSSATKVEY